MRRADATHCSRGSCSNGDSWLAAQAPRLRAVRRRHGRHGVRDRDVVRRRRLAGVLDPPRPARPRARRARDVPAAAAPRAARRPSRRPVSPSHRARALDRPRRARRDRAPRRHAGGRERDVAVLRARLRHGRRHGAGCARRPRADALARPPGDPRQGVRPAVGRVPAVRDRRARARRAPLRGAARARVRRVGGVLARRAAGRARDALRARRRRSRLARPRERARRRPPRPPHARAARRDLPRPVRRPLRRRRCAAARVREGRAGGGAGRAGRPPCGSRGGGVVRGRGALPASAPPPRRPDAAHRRRGLRDDDDRLRPLRDDVAVARSRWRRAARSTW